MIVLSKTDHTKGILLLLVTTVVWGTSFPLLKQVLQDLTPPMILAVRFTVAAIAFIPYLYRLKLKLLRDGAILGLIYFTECLLALLGLETISAHRSAFIISLNVILVPLLGSFLGQRVSLRILAAGGVAIAGMSLLSWETGSLGWGDLLTFGCAIGVAIYILTLEVMTPQHSPLPLVAVQLGTMAILSMGWAVLSFPGQLSEVFIAIKPHFNTLLYLGLGVSGLPLWTQALAQRWVPASEAALLYTLEPVFASAFSFAWLGETLGTQAVFGAGLILAATLLSQRPDRGSK
ncbi:MAG: DMT family transporter [Leptolyngbyaceae cyanobacterium bins.302]|nr:DMT family transporter [Leptolyngbyaceae cyanobacterium bins.302]